MTRLPPSSTRTVTLFPSPTLFRSQHPVREPRNLFALGGCLVGCHVAAVRQLFRGLVEGATEEREGLDRLRQRHPATLELSPVRTADRGDRKSTRLNSSH